MSPPTVMPVLYEEMARKCIREIKDYEFWHWLCTARKPAANSIARSKDLDQICEIIKANEDGFIAQTETGRQRNAAAKGQGKGDGNGKGKGKGKEKGKGKGKNKGEKGARTGPDPNKPPRMCKFHATGSCPNNYACAFFRSEKAFQIAQAKWNGTAPKGKGKGKGKKGGKYHGVYGVEAGADGEGDDEGEWDEEESMALGRTME